MSLLPQLIDLTWSISAAFLARTINMQNEARVAICNTMGERR